MYNILFVASEAHPLVKTGGLADVAASLPQALERLGQDVRIFMPAYQSAKESAPYLNHLTDLNLPQGDAALLETQLPDSTVKVWLLDFPPFYDRPGNPYLNETGKPWSDNDQRFAFFCRVATEIAQGRAGLEWRPDVVHCNDWQSGLVPALLSLEASRPATLFTIHNLAYQGIFPYTRLAALSLPEKLWGYDALEFHGQMSFIKGGLAFADRVSTVSPNYAREIQTPEFGCGLDGLLRHRRSRLTGILNGIDCEQWNPETDPLIAENYGTDSLENKDRNRSALRQEVGLPDLTVPLAGLIGRLVQQKGIDLVLEALPRLLALPLQIVILGSGDSQYEQKLLYWSRRFPDRLSVTIDYSESLSHLIEAGADMFLMPSRFEPCGLNQIYSQRYGTLPIVREIGGLADTVVDADPVSLLAETATGVSFGEASGGALLEAVKRALVLHLDQARWRTMQKTAMAKDFCWRHSAEQYLELYGLAIQDCRDQGLTLSPRKAG